MSTRCLKWRRKHAQFNRLHQVFASIAVFTMYYTKVFFNFREIQTRRTADFFNPTVCSIRCAKEMFRIVYLSLSYKPLYIVHSSAA